MWRSCVLVLLALGLTDAQQGCTSTTMASTFGLYQCDHGNIVSYAATFTGASFNPVPEELWLNNIVSNTIAANSFAGMSGITNNSFASNTVPKLVLTCVRNNYLHFQNTSFIGLEYVEWFSIRQCNILEIDGWAFAPLKTLYSFDISEGHIGSLVPESFKGIEMKSDFSQYGLGTVNLTSTLPTLATVPENIFVPFAGVTHLNLQGFGLASVPLSAFGDQPALVTLNLTNNLYMDLRDCSFIGMSSVSLIEMYGVRFTCDCSSHIWMIDWAKTNHVKLKSDWRCSNTENSLVRYKKDVCDTPPVGFWLLEVYWYGAEKILLWIINIISFAIAIAALAILDKARMRPKLKRRPPAKDPQKPRPKGLKRAADKVRRMQRKMNLGWG